MATRAQQNFGKLLQPPIDLSAEQFKRLDGAPYLWQPELHRWRLVFVSDKPCLKQCQAMLDTLHRVWLSRGRHAESIDLLWFAAVPQETYDFKGFVPMQTQTALTKTLPELESIAGYPVYIINPSGFVILQYPAGFDPSGLRKDLAKLVK